MKLHILSDLHLEFSPLVVPAVHAEILILAGDIGKDTSGVDFAKSLSSRYQHILYVAGNHEFYGYDIDTVKANIRRATENTNIHFLDNDVFTLNGVDFIGSTLWTDFRLYSSDKQFVNMSRQIAGQGLNDFRLIKNGGRYFTPEDCEKMCLANQAYILEQLQGCNKKVVITHHCPSRKSIARKYEGDMLNSAFANNLDSLVEKSDLWVHGHTHSEFDYSLGKSRVVCNPRGYSKHQDKQENTEFNIGLVVEI